MRQSFRPSCWYFSMLRIWRQGGALPGEQGDAAEHASGRRDGQEALG